MSSAEEPTTNTWANIVAYLQTTSERPDYHAASHEFWAELHYDLQRAFPDKATRTYVNLREAIRRMRDEINNPFISDLGHELKKYLRLVIADAAKAGGDTSADLEEAKRKSWGCEECGGEGLTSRYLPTGDRQRERSTSCYCHRCAAGRAMERVHRTKYPDVRKRIVDIRGTEYEHECFAVPRSLRNGRQLSPEAEAYVRRSRAAEATRAVEEEPAPF